MRRADDFTAFICRVFDNPGSLYLGAYLGLYRVSFTLFCTVYYWLISMDTNYVTSFSLNTSSARIIMSLAVVCRCSLLNKSICHWNPNRYTGIHNTRWYGCREGWWIQSRNSTMERIRPVYIWSASGEAAVVKGATCDVAEYNIKTDHKEIELKSVSWIYLAENRDQW